MRRGDFVRGQAGLHRLAGKALLPLRGGTIIQHVMRNLSRGPADLRALVTEARAGKLSPRLRRRRDSAFLSGQRSMCWRATAWHAGNMRWTRSFGPQETTPLPPRSWPAASWPFTMEAAPISATTLASRGEAASRWFDPRRFSRRKGKRQIPWNGSMPPRFFTVTRTSFAYMSPRRRRASSSRGQGFRGHRRRLCAGEADIRRLVQGRADRGGRAGDLVFGEDMSGVRGRSARPPGVLPAGPRGW